MPTHLLLDAGGVVFVVLPVMFFIALVVIIFLEGMVLAMAKYASFKRSLRDSLLANLVSLGIGFIAAFVLGDWEPMYEYPILIFFILSLLAESAVILPLRGQNAIGKTLLLILGMNVLSYLFIIWARWAFGIA